MNNGLPDLIRNVLSNPSSEQAMQSQMIDLARRNLHVPEVLAVYSWDPLPAIRDTAVQHQLLDILMNLDTARFENLDKLHEALKAIFQQEKERSVRAALISRFAAAVHQDERLHSFLARCMASTPVMSDEERGAVQAAIARLPTIAQATAIAALERARQAPSTIQTMAVTIAEGYPEWGESMAAALAPYLEPRVQRELRLRILTRLAR